MATRLGKIFTSLQRFESPPSLSVKQDSNFSVSTPQMLQAVLNQSRKSSYKNFMTIFENLESED